MIRKTSIILIVPLLGTLFFIACGPIPKLSKGDKLIIKEVIKSPIPEIIQGDTGFAISQEHSIWYEHIEPKINSKGTIVLIMGNGNDALSWPSGFVTSLVNKGYQVIRFDHRGTGLSTTTKKWRKKDPYSLNDMAGDVIAILNKVHIEKAHIVGASMGGMIAQLVAIENPERTASLTSIMSSGDVMDAELPPMSDEVLPKMISTVLKKGFFGNRKGQIQRQIIQKRILMGEATGEIDVKALAAVSYYNLKERQGYNLMAARHHYEAILISQPRIEKLKSLKIPSLIIHGIQDPVLPIEHGKKLVATIPKADSLWIENMGHDLPDSAIPIITKNILVHVEGSNHE